MAGSPCWHWSLDDLSLFLLQQQLLEGNGATADSRESSVPWIEQKIYRLLIQKLPVLDFDHICLKSKLHCCALTILDQLVVINNSASINSCHFVIHARKLSIGIDVQDIEPCHPPYQYRF